MRYLIAFLMAIILISCESSTTRLNRQLPGEWKLVYSKWDCISCYNSDSTESNSFDYSIGHTRTVFQTFHRNGTFSLDDHSGDVTVYRSAGTWLIKQDSLFVTDTFPVRGNARSYKLEIVQDTAQLWRTFDFDHDGLQDDLFYSKMAKVSEVD